MGFGDFAMGYLVGQSFSGPNHIPDGNTPYSEWSSQAKKDWDKKCDEAYWRAWDRAFKNKTIERLRAHESNFNLFTFRGDFLYPSLSQDEQADMLERGEIKLLILRDKQVQLGLWANDERDEAKVAIYLDRMEQIKYDMENGNYRIID
ncbi:hypothetical protein T36_0593 [Helicobacter cinaedi]|uniref:hypothetical protein n=1 Tax=Helicobacter cinaedi TaxID=213 RepID=UPI001F40B723|nr:hypothetical protein [Helicobacter cinaedi]BDB64146.1 hypothetical protein T36_0593 [Helicobacter cinaedi]